MGGTVECSETGATDLSYFCPGMKSIKRVFSRRTKPRDDVATVPPPDESGPKQETEATQTEGPMAQEQAEQSGAQENEAPCKVYIVFYSMYGHIHKMAEAMKKGIDTVEGCRGILYQVPETLSETVLEKMHAPPKPDVPIIQASELPKANGILFGFPTRFGMMCAQMKALFDATGGLWQSGALAGKPAGLFVSTGTQGGGQETTILTALTQLVHHGMIFIPPGYTHGAPLFGVEEVRGGSPWGAGTFAAADGSRQPSDSELAAAEHQGAYFASKAKLLTA